MREPIARLDTSDPGFDAAFARLLVGPAESDSALAETVSSIISAVAVEGDAALLRFTNEFDGRALSDPANFRVSPSALVSALQAIDPEVRVAWCSSRMDPKCRGISHPANGTSFAPC